MQQGQLRFQQPPAAPGAQPQHFAPQQQVMQLPAPQFVQPAAMYQQPMSMVMPAPVYPPFQPITGYYQQPGMAQPSPYGAHSLPQMQSFGPQFPATAAETRAERDARYESERAERQEQQRRELEDAQEKQRRLAEDAQHKAELQAIAQGKAVAPKPEKPVVASKPKKEKQQKSELRRWCDEFIEQHPVLSKFFQLCVLAMLAAGTQEILRTTGAWKGLGDTNSQGGSMRDDLENALGKDIGGGISDGFEKVGDFMTDIDPALAPLVVLALIVALCALNRTVGYLVAKEAAPDPKPDEEVEMTEISRPS